jgi:hypothetical protein
MVICPTCFVNITYLGKKTLGWAAPEKVDTGIAKTRYDATGEEDYGKERNMCQLSPVIGPLVLRLHNQRLPLPRWADR